VQSRFWLVRNDVAVFHWGHAYLRATAHLNKVTH